MVGSQEVKGQVLHFLCLPGKGANIVDDGRMEIQEIAHELNNSQSPSVQRHRLQGNDTERKGIHYSGKTAGDRGCDKCTYSQVQNFWPLQQKNFTECERIYWEIASSPIQWKTEMDVIKSVAKLQKCQWHKQEVAAEELRSELKRCCHAAYNCLVTQKNMPVGTELIYDAESKKKIKITPQIFSIFPKNSFFSGRQYRRCAVIGNGGILANSSCGAEIDQADFVFRCNLPPMGGEFTRDIGTKTNLVTANPSIIQDRYAKLQDRRRSFFTNLAVYDEALLLLPAFSYSANTDLCFRALYTLQDFQAKQKVVFFNPVYLKNLTNFWLSKGIHVKRLSTGIMVVSVAVELCEEVWIYGFWPFGKNVEGKVVSHHYFDNLLPKPDTHSMPLEFHHLLQMHGKGMIKLQMTQCQADPK
ncbi:alpha-2,8-sialyltransferase 8F-like isoform X2 [Heterodontus francisci]|uniref:alpha-2,8-sialyltransferase 8F-like isoform X2 n=1 Tax=Heterodontus francisci TaxID=7792 RepID=UPI00355C8FAE